MRHFVQSIRAVCSKWTVFGKRRIDQLNVKFGLKRTSTRATFDQSNWLWRTGDRSKRRRNSAIMEGDP
jgi:hypothetical protein